MINFEAQMEPQMTSPVLWTFMSVQSSSCNCAYVKIKWLCMYGEVTHQKSLNNMVGSNSFCEYKEASTESTGGFQRSGESSEILALHVNSVYIFEVKRAIMSMFYLYFSSAER